MLNICELASQKSSIPEDPGQVGLLERIVDVSVGQYGHMVVGLGLVLFSSEE